MSKRLSELLEEIGQEEHDDMHIMPDGTIQPRSVTKDEALARAIWDRALGCERVKKNGDGTEIHHICPPDPKMQQFIIERREGKIVIPIEPGGTTLLDKIDEIAKAEANDLAEQSLDDDRDDDSSS